jgi:hypothetical protein
LRGGDHMPGENDETGTDGFAAETDEDDTEDDGEA